MKRFLRILLCVALLCTSFLSLSGCGKLSFDQMIDRYQVPLSGCSVTVHFLDEISGGTDVYTLMEGETAETFIASLFYSTPIAEPKDAYSIHLNASYQIVLASADTERLNLYYDDENDWLVSEVAQQKGEEVVMRYNFYRPDPIFLALLDIAAEQKTSSDSTESLQTSSLVLRAGISTDMLTQSGTAVDYELYTGAYAHSGDESLYKIYTSADLPDVVQGSTGLVVAALGACPTTGYYIYISQIDYTDHLIRVFVHVESPIYPDDEEAVETYPYVMATCDLDDFPLGLTVAFIDQNYNILDVQTLQVP